MIRAVRTIAWFICGTYPTPYQTAVTGSTLLRRKGEAA